MAVQQVFSSDDLRKNILSYVVYDVYKCSLCGECCSPLDSILYKQKTNLLIHFDEYGNKYVETYTENNKQIQFIAPNIILCNEFTTKYHYYYYYNWTHKSCCNHYAMIGEWFKVPMYSSLCSYIDNFHTRYSKIKTNGNVNKDGNDIINLIKDGNLLFTKHKNKKTQEKAEYFENLMYEEAGRIICIKTTVVKKRFEVANDELNERRERLKQHKTKEMLCLIRPEIFTNMLIKKYQEKEIDFNTFRKNMINIETYRYNDNLQIQI